MYVGWGGLANDFFDDYNPKFSKEREDLKSLVTEKEYSDMKQSSLTAYYTDPAIIRQMWDKLEADGFSGGKIYGDWEFLCGHAKAFERKK
ncbi:hypothetical protein STRIC_1202 [Streptococcus ictaluri 707-05]|uniref:Uncharacterized protein n=1 Tax=Streptococcus ictaluri 707-05 TaxID=764299 RepID=G5K334_9STRE|nr:hypothetical protein STRIC_1202 [Streptococcus ictaluri 707-05]